MNMLLRFWYLLLQITFKQIKTQNFDAPLTRRYRVGLHDLGWRDHLPNYRFLSFIELNTTQWLKTQTSLRKAVWLMAAQEVIYLKPVAPLSGFEITSQVIGWDTKYLFLRHEFKVKNKLVATAITKIIVLKNKQAVASEVITGSKESLNESISTFQAHQQAVKNAS